MADSLTSDFCSLKTNYHTQLFDTISDVANIWDQLAPKDNIFLQRPYLELLERFPPKGFQFYYLVFFKKETPIGIAPLQKMHFVSKEAVNLSNSESKFFERSREQLLKVLNFDFLICGNAALTGEYAFHFQTKALSDLEQFQLVEEGLTYAKKTIEKKYSKRIDGILIKEFKADK
ncbi:MAG: hypothetical protein AAF738_09800, partial [Bacteroidota bacterium]